MKKKTISGKIRKFYHRSAGLIDRLRGYSDSSLTEEEIVDKLDELNKELDIPEITLLDIGARFGTHLDLPLQRSDIEVEYIGIEPEKEEYLRLREENPEATFYQVALGEEEKEMDLNITRHKGCSSLLEPNTELLENFPWISGWFETEDKVSVETANLSTLCREESIDPDLIKSDTQGYEYQIFRSSKDILEDVLMLEFEAHFKEMYRDQALFGDIDVLLRSENFELIDLMNVKRWNKEGIAADHQRGVRSNSELVEVDPLYRRRLGELTEAEEKKLYALMASYGKFDTAKRVARGSETDTGRKAVKIL